MKYLLTLLLLILVSSCTAQKTAEKKNLTPVPAHEHKMASYFQTSKKINASPTVDQLIQTALKDPSNSEPLYSLGYLHMQNGISNKNVQELELAEAYLTEALRQFPGNQSILQALYNIYYDNTLRNRSTDAFDKATAIFTQLPESLRPDVNPPSLAKYGATLVQQEKDRQPDRQALRNILLQAIHEAPLTDTSYIQLARLYREDRYFALAIATLKLGAENIPNSADLYQSIGETYTKRADVTGCNYEHKSDIQNAGKYYQLAMPLAPDSQKLHFALSQSFFDQNLGQLGLNEAQIALELKPTRESISLNAQNFSTLGYHQKALSLLQQAIAQGYGPNDVGYHEIHMNQGDWKKAAISFSSYVKSREKFSVYDFIKSDMIAHEAQAQPWLMSSNVSIGNTWEQALLNYWASRTSAEDLKKMANTSCEKTEFYFYTGYKDLISGKKAQANSKFTAAINQNTYRFIERPLARYFLARD